MPRRILALILDSVASGIRLVNVNRVSFEIDDNGNEFVRKFRSQFSWPLITIGNLVFRFRRAPLKVLPRQQWLEWEQQVNQVLGRHCYQLENNQLAFEKLSGRPLIQCLKQQHNVEAKLKLISAASVALWNFHQQSVADWQLSHGDASAQNVLINQGNDLETHVAKWFDFDLKHGKATEPTLRHADDLRAFLFTSAIQFDSDSIAQFVDTVRANYDAPQTWRALQEQVSAPSFTFDIFHRAQVRRANLDPAISVDIIRAVELNVIDSIRSRKNNLENL